MDNYYTKYLKYKNKYLELKGGSFEEIKRLKEEGKTLEQIMEARYTRIEQIIAAGYTDIELLKEAGFTAMDFKKANVPLRFLVSVEMLDKSYRNFFNLHELLEGGYTQQDFKDSYITRMLFERSTPFDREKAGFDKIIPTPELLNYLENIKPKLPSLQELMIRQEENIKKIKDEIKIGTSLKVLADTYKISELMIAGFDKEKLLSAKLPASKLVGNISLHDLMDAYYSPKELKEAGVSLIEMMDVRNKEACRKLLNPHHQPINIKVYDLLDAGFTEEELRVHGYTEEVIKQEKKLLEMIKKQQLESHDK